MRATFAAPLLLAALASFGGLASAAEPTCSKWDLEVTCTTDPARVIVTDPFTATVTVRNSGDQALNGVTIQIRGDLGAHPTAAEKGPLQLVVEKLEPGESKQLSGPFACDTVGMTRIIAGARDAQGWAAANCACTVEVIGLPALQSGMIDEELQAKDKGTAHGIFRMGESFQYVLEVQNDAGTTVTPDLKVNFTLPKELEFVSGSGDKSITVTGTGQASETSAFVLAPNETVKITVVVKVIAVPTSEIGGHTMNGGLVQTKATIQTTGGVPIAEESESSTLKN